MGNNSKKFGKAKCEECGKRFGTRKSLMKHIEAVGHWIKRSITASKYLR